MGKKQMKMIMKALHRMWLYHHFTPLSQVDLDQIKAMKMPKGALKTRGDSSIIPASCDPVIPCRGTWSTQLIPLWPCADMLRSIDSHIGELKLHFLEPGTCEILLGLIILES